MFWVLLTSSSDINVPDCITPKSVTIPVHHINRENLVSFQPGKLSHSFARAVSVDHCIICNSDTSKTWNNFLFICVPIIFEFCLYEVVSSHTLSSFYSNCNPHFLIIWLPLSFMQFITCVIVNVSDGSTILFHVSLSVTRSFVTLFRHCYNHH